MEVIIGLRPACRASLPNRHTPIKPTFRFPSPVEIVDLLSPANRVFNIIPFALSAHLPNGGMGGRTQSCPVFSVSGENAYG
jgi:hypothetical protein